jgi:hypothetical protein
MPSGSKSGKEAKRRIVAKGMIEGQTRSAIAEEAGCSTRHVQKIAAEPETRILVTRLLQPHEARLKKLVPKAINAVEKALIARKTDKADHAARLRAVGRAAQLFGMAQGNVPEERSNDGGGIVTWEELQILYRRHRETTNAD